MPVIRIYHLRIVPPEPIYSDIVSFKQQFRDTFGNLKYSKSKPHITLAFFNMDVVHEPEMIKHFEALSNSKSFTIQIKGINSFEEESYVLFLDIVNPQPVLDIQTKIQQLWLNGLQHKTSELTISNSPHVTISTTKDKATLDESFKIFVGINYSEIFKVDHLVLTSRLPGKTWDWEYQIALR